MTKLRRIHRLPIGIAALTILLSLLVAQLATARLGTEESDEVREIGSRVEVTTGVSNGIEWSLSVSMSTAGECINLTLERASVSGGGCGYGLLEGKRDLAVGIFTDHASQIQYVMGLTRSGVDRVLVEDAAGSVGDTVALPAGLFGGESLSAFVLPVLGDVVVDSVTAFGPNDEVVARESIPHPEVGDPDAPVTDHDDSAHATDPEH